MPNRVISVVLRGEIGDFVGKMRASSSAVKATVASMTDGSKESAAFRQNLTSLGNTAGKFGLVAAGGVALAVRAFANFDEAMSAVAASGEDARGSIDALREAAIDAGARTKFSATEAAAAIENLAKAGVSAKDILGGGLDGALNLAAAGGLDVAQAAEIAATAMNQFGLSGADVPHVADLLSAAAGKAMGSVADMGAAFKFVGPVASQLGVSMEQTAGTIALLAQNGVLGEQAGTSLRGILSSLTSPSKIASDTMAELGLNMYNASGEFIGLEGVAGALQTSLGGLSNAERDAALGRIFGNEQITAARILYAGGAEDVKKWTDAVDDQGFAAETAAIKMDNLKGDLEKLKGSLETALIGTGEGANGPLREMVQLLGGLVDAYNELPGPIKTTILAGAGLTAAVGGSAFAVTRAIDAFSGLRTNLEGVGASFEKANKKALATRVGIGAVGLGLTAISGPAHNADESLGKLVDTAAAVALGFAVAGPWGAALAGGVSLLSAFGGQSASAAAQQKKLDSAGASVASTLDAQTGALTDLTRATAAKELADAGVLDAAKQMGISLKTTLDAALGNADALKQVTDASEAWANASAKSGDYTEKEEAALNLFRDGVGATTEAIEEQRKKTGQVAEATGGLSSEFDTVGVEARDAAAEVQSLSDALDDLLNPLLSQDQATVAWRQSLMSLNEDLSKQGRSLDLNTKAGLDNRNAIRDRVEALQASAAADSEAGVAADKVGDKLKRGRSAIIDAGVAAGFSEREMRKYLKQLGLTPANIKTLIQAQDGATPKITKVKTGLGILDGITAAPRIALAGAGAAQSAINGVSVGLALLPKEKTITIYTRNQTKQATGGEAGLGVRAQGPVVGPGTGTSDSIPALLSNGEHVLTAAEVQKAGGQGAIYRMRAAIMAGVMPAFAAGGAVGQPASPLELKQQEKTIRDIERSLAEREKFGKKPKKGRDTRPSRNVLRGLDRQIALLELSEAKQDLRDLKSGKESRLEAREKAKQDAIDAANDLSSAQTSAKGSILSQFKLGDNASPLSVEKNLSRLIANAREFTALLASLKSKGASPWLLAQLVEAGPTGAAIRLARQYDNDAAALASINGQAGLLDQISSQYGQLVADPRFMAPGAFNAGYAPPTGPTVVRSSLVGAEVAMGTDGVIRFVQGQIMTVLDGQATEARFG